MICTLSFVTWLQNFIWYEPIKIIYLVTDVDKTKIGSILYAEDSSKKKKIRGDSGMLISYLLNFIKLLLYFLFSGIYFI